MIVYEVTCLVNGRRYIGATGRHVASRWESHCADARNGGKAPLHEAMREHGADQFSTRVIACARSKADLKPLEESIIKQEGTVWPTGYNAHRNSGVWEQHAWRERIWKRRGSSLKMPSFFMSRKKHSARDEA